MKIQLLAILLFSNIVTINDDYMQIFGDDYQDALVYLTENESYIDSLSNKFGNDHKLLKAIIFPELIRYSLIRDYLEIGSLELIYVSTGKIDFSIGTFQMKPSFIENLEKYFKSHMDLFKKYDNYLPYLSERPIDIRKERLMRLKSMEYQLVYLNLFYDLMEKWHPNVFLKDKEYQVRFLSTAYNHGFEASVEEISSYMNKKFFPFGINNDKRKYNYSDIAWDYIDKNF